MPWITRILLACSLCLTACAGGSLKKLDDAQGIPAELQQDLGQFEVREAATPQPSPVPQEAEQKKQARSARKKPAKLAEARPAGFVVPRRRPAVDPIRVGERAVYDITYFGMVAGEFSIGVEPFKEINGRKVYHVLGRATSSKVFSLFYKLNDTIETFIDYDGIFPHRFHILLDESKQKRNSLELFDSEKGRTFFWNRWDHHKCGYTEVKDFFPMQPFSQDSLSSLFYIRTLPLKDGDVTTFPVVSEGKNWDAVITVLRHEVIDTPMGPLKTIVLKPETKYQGILKKQGDSFLWVTDDDRRFMVKLEAKVKIGSIIARLKSFEPGALPAGTGAGDAPPASIQPIGGDEALPPSGAAR